MCLSNVHQLSAINVSNRPYQEFAQKEHRSSTVWASPLSICSKVSTRPWASIEHIGWAQIEHSEHRLSTHWSTHWARSKYLNERLSTVWAYAQYMLNMQMNVLILSICSFDAKDVLSASTCLAHIEHMLCSEHMLSFEHMLYFEHTSLP